MNPIIIRILMQVLADRVLVVTTLFLNFALFAYAIANPDLTRFAIAGMFAVTCFLPVLYYNDKKRAVSDGTTFQQAA